MRPSAPQITDSRSSAKGGRAHSRSRCSTLWKELGTSRSLTVFHAVDKGGTMMNVMTQPDSHPLQSRRSACAERAREAEVVRIGQMTVEERIKAALRMGQRFSWLKPAPVSPRNG